LAEARALVGEEDPAVQEGLGEEDTAEDMDGADMAMAEGMALDGAEDMEGHGIRDYFIQKKKREIF